MDDLNAKLLIGSYQSTLKSMRSGAITPLAELRAELDQIAGQLQALGYDLVDVRRGKWQKMGGRGTFVHTAAALIEQYKHAQAVLSAPGDTAITDQQGNHATALLLHAASELGRMGWRLNTDESEWLPPAEPQRLTGDNAALIQARRPDDQLGNEGGIE